MRSLICIVMLTLLIPVAALAENAVILESEGNVTVKSLGQSSSATTGLNLSPGDIITTGDDGTALILLSDGSRIDLFPNSRLQLVESQTGLGKKSSLLGELWQSIKEKFTDATYSSAQAGGVGALRAFGDEEEIINDELTDPLLEELEGNLVSIDAEKLPENTSRLMKAILYEIYGQYFDAEKTYLSMVEADPQDPVTYDMLTDLYMKIDCFNHAKEIIELKLETIGQ